MSQEQPELITPETNPDEQWERGWYEYAGGLRFWDGGWTDQYAPPTRMPEPKPINYFNIAFAVAAGMVIGWLAIWLLAQIAPETFYWPVRFVVEELPTFQ